MSGFGHCISVSSTESELEEPASTDQEEAASTEQDEAASTEPEFIVTTPTFPERLFARNCYPGKPRLNIYSKASIIGSLVKLLRGSPEMNCLLGSQFGALFHLPVSRCSNSAKLVHSLLSRQLVTMRLYELWFLFADKPLRFSLREFGDITGLKCEPEREKVGNGSESIDATPGRMWKELFETEDEDVTVPDVLRMLEQPSLPEWKRLPLALIALVDGLLVCGHKLLRVTPAYVEMLEDTRSFLQYPWGREAFVSTLSRLTPPQPSDPSKMDKSLSEQELKEWIRVELKTQLGKLRNEIFDWLHHDRGGSFTVLQNTAAGKTNRDNSHADPTGMEGPKKRRPFSGDGNDEAEIFWSDSKKHKKNNGDGFSDEETMRMHDNHCDGRTPNARFWEKVDSMAGEGPSFSKSANIPEVDVSTPIGPKIVSKPAKPTLPEPLEVFSVDYQLFVLVSEVYRNTDLFGQGEGGDESPISGLNLLAEEEQGGKASPTNSEDYKTPPEDDPMTECRTPDVGNSKLSRYLTRSLKKAELEGKCIPISSTKKDDLQTKRIPRRSTKIGGVYTPDKRLKKFFQSCKKPKYMPLADLEKAQFQEFQSILREKPAQEFKIVIGIHVSNKFFLSLARPTNWVSTEFEKASDKLGFNWGGLVSFSFTGKMPRRNDKKVLLVDVDRVYAPMMWGKDHWVGLVINLTCRQVEILDCNIPLNESDNEVNKHMAYLLRPLPHVFAAFSPPSDSSHPEEDQAFSWVRPDNIYFNERSCDCGPCAVKFLEMHAAGYSYEDMRQIDDKKVDIFRQKYAMDTYEKFIGNAKVQNDG
ncbi:BnaC09g51910D [Brassica napus]|uniref:BnaC09g51910D protein n=1 Tax=Brassica napus TaxID=3708 RepID=A0A078IX71_BRANA|nr:BnaC09g51910D [Brassica napus]